MAMRGPRYCGCGRIVQPGARCACQVKRDAERKVRFDAKRPSSSARGYSSKWEQYREHYLRKHPTCTRCGAPATVVDHIKAHKGNMAIFWDHLNHQSLCAHCHNTWKQSVEKRGDK
jgi:5-methylcytosine-specific restriction protein A